MVESQDILRSEIRAILGNCSLSEREKSVGIQQLMSSSRNSPSTATTNCLDNASQPGYYNADLKILGCEHYQLNAKVKAPCCDAWIACRFCHNDTRNHTMDRFAVKLMKCMLCLEEQPVGQHCRRCKKTMARYYCSQCKLLDDGPDKHIFHCEHCGICMSGCSDEYYHCAGCDACVATKFRDTHGCREQILHSDCPICNEQFHGSTHAIVQAPCKHLIHEKCLEESLKYSYKCPICSASLCSAGWLFSAIEDYMRTSQMPLEYRARTSQIFCNDCQQRSAAKFHFVYHKCGRCCSYNTVVVSTS